MSTKSTLFAGLLALMPGFASAHVMIEDAYARVSSAMAQSGAVFMTIYNHNDFAEVLTGASSDVAQRVELHTHIQNAEGVMRMVEVEGGIPMAADETVMLERGGLHVMLLGLNRALAHGDSFSLTLEFENSDPITIEVPVDLERTPSHGGGEMQHDHGQMDHGNHGAAHGSGG
ncbi:copper chaperone PCu(A)C [Roseicyclus sp.]|uniref:copper chaperone PCu(A)C n=1 Tax=Roseicyclus sp. TaxID=1914329 RepID=UPI003F6B87ED